MISAFEHNLKNWMLILKNYEKQSNEWCNTLCFLVVVANVFKNGLINDQQQPLIRKPSVWKQKTIENFNSTPKKANDLVSAFISQVVYLISNNDVSSKKLVEIIALEMSAELCSNFII
jgi:hypothetical protein